MQSIIILFIVLCALVLLFFYLFCNFVKLIVATCDAWSEYHCSDDYSCPDYSQIEAIFCPSFGKRKEGINLSNDFLAKKIVEFYAIKKLPLIIQSDVADAMPSDIKVDKTISQHQVPGKYLDTLEVSRQCVKYCEENGYKKIIVFAHPDHLPRVIKTISFFGLNYETGNNFGCPYDSKSSQIWTRNRFVFLFREVFVILYYSFKMKKNTTN